MAAPYRSAQVLGWTIANVPSASTVQTNAAANWFALAFTPDSGRTLSEVRAYVSAVAGSLGASDITADLYDSTGSNGAPGSSIETGKVPTATITAAGYYTFNGFTTVLTSGMLYWIVFKNVNGTPASNNCTFRTITQGVNVYTCGASAGSRTQGWGNASSTNSGSTWSANFTRTCTRIGYADGTYDGIVGNSSASAAVGDGVYGTRESGVKFTNGNAALRVAGLSFAVQKSGTPTGLARFGLWTGSTPVNQGYTASLPTGITLNGSIYYLYFASPIIVPPNAIVRVTLGETTQSDASGNRQVLQEIPWDTDSNSTILLPWNGTAQKTYFDGSSWTDTALGTSLFQHGVILDTAQEFPPRAPELIIAPPQSY